MAQSTPPGSQQPQTEDEGANAIARAAEGPDAKLSDGEERAGLDFLLGTPQAVAYKTTVEYETPEAGMVELTFHFRSVDGRKLDKIERRHISDKTGEMDKIGADLDLVAEGVTHIEDAKGQKIALTDEKFRTLKAGESPLAATTDALEARFGKQMGLIAGVARTIREAGGWNADRVGKASRVLVAAAEN